MHVLEGKKNDTTIYIYKYLIYDAHSYFYFLEIFENSF